MSTSLTLDTRVQLPAQGDWYAQLPEHIRKSVSRETGKPVRKMTVEDYKTFQAAKNKFKQSRLSRAAVNSRLRTRLMKHLGEGKYKQQVVEEVLNIPMSLIERENTSTGVFSYQRVIRLDLEAMADRALREAPDRQELLLKFLKPGEAVAIEDHREEAAAQLYRDAIVELERRDAQRHWEDQMLAADREERVAGHVKRWKESGEEHAEPQAMADIIASEHAVDEMEKFFDARDAKEAEFAAQRKAELEAHAATMTASDAKVYLDSMRATRVRRPKRANPRVRAARAGRATDRANPGQAARALKQASEKDRSSAAMIAPAPTRVLMEVQQPVAVEACVGLDEEDEDDPDDHPCILGPFSPSSAAGPSGPLSPGRDIQPPAAAVCDGQSLMPLASRFVGCDPNPQSDPRSDLVISKSSARASPREVREMPRFQDIGDEPEDHGLDDATPHERFAICVVTGTFVVLLNLVCMAARRVCGWLRSRSGIDFDRPDDVPEDVWNTACRLADQVKYPNRVADRKVLADGLRSLRAGIKLRHPTVQRDVNRAAADASWHQRAQMCEEDDRVIQYYMWSDVVFEKLRKLCGLVAVLLVLFCLWEMLPTVVVSAERFGGVAHLWSDVVGSVRSHLEFRASDVGGVPEATYKSLQAGIVSSVNHLRSTRFTFEPLVASIAAAGASIALTARRQAVIEPMPNAPVTSDGYVDSVRFVAPDVDGAYVFPANSTNTVCLGFGNEGNLSADCKIRTAERSATCLSKDGKGATLVGWTTSISHVLRKCLCNAHNAITNRHGAKPPPVVDDVCEVLPDFLDVFRGLDAEYLMHPMREWANWFSKWPASKQRAFTHSRETEDVEPGKVKAMVKREVSHNLPKKARLIQFYKTLATQSEFGPEFYALQKVVTETFRRHRMGDIDITFASGMNARELGAWMENVLADGAVMFYERDGKNWDSSMQKEHAAFRRGFYAGFDDRLADFVGKCDKVKGAAVFPGGILRYSVNYTVKSGHNDTTLGNSLVNAAIAYAAFKRANIPASILVAGDDLLVATYDYVNVEELVSAESRYGITPEAQTFVDFERVTFISGTWMSDGNQIGFVPQPGRLFARLWWSVRPPSHRQMAMYLRGVARGLAGVVGTMPLVRTFVGSFDSEGEARLVSDKCYNYRGAAFYFQEDDIYGAYMRRYGLARGDIEECEAWLRSLPRSPLYLKHRVLSRIMEVDLADIMDRERISYEYDMRMAELAKRPSARDQLLARVEEEERSGQICLPISDPAVANLQGADTWRNVLRRRPVGAQNFDPRRNVLRRPLVKPNDTE